MTRVSVAWGTVLAMGLTVAQASGGELDSDARGEFRRVFVTSATGTGDLSTWADAGIFTGLDAADAVCQTRASAAGLPNAPNYIAWMSDSSDDAYCRLHGLSGKKDNNCGQPQLPEAAGPWLRTDDLPFSEAVELALNPAWVVYYPPRRDEFGTFVPVTGLEPYVFTANGLGGELFSGDDACQDWTSDAAGLVRIGDVTLTANGWSSAGATNCSAELRLLCLERVAGPDLPIFGITGPLIFVTSTTGPGNLAAWAEADPGTTGVDAGDSICRNLAETAGLEDAMDFKAWLSTSTENAVDRLQTTGPWVRPDGVVIANNPGTLVSEARASSVSVTETGDYLGNYSVWTGSNDDGTGYFNHCGNWQDGSAGSNGGAGSAYRSANGWLRAFDVSCDSQLAHLYCIQDVDPDVVLRDGFEGSAVPM